MPRLLIVSANPQSATLYRGSVERQGVRCEAVQSITEMFERMVTTPFNGLLLDVPTAIRASEKEKSMLQIVAEVYPTLRVRWDGKSHQMRGLMLGKTLDPVDPVADFIDRFCRSQPARICRRDKRHAIHFNVLLSRDKTFPPEHTEKVFTLDISEGGCFLFSSGDWQNGDTAWVRFVGFDDPEPIPLEVRRSIRWGEKARIPGIGVCFKSLRPGQLQELRRHLASPMRS